MRKLAIPGQQYTDLCENWLMRYEKIDERFVLRLLVLRIDRRSFPKKGDGILDLYRLFYSRDKMKPSSLRDM